MHAHELQVPAPLLVLREGTPRQRLHCQAFVTGRQQRRRCFTGGTFGSRPWVEQTFGTRQRCGAHFGSASGEAAPPHDVSRQRVQDVHSHGLDFTLTATGQTGSLVSRSASDTGITAPAGGREEPLASRHWAPRLSARQAGRSRWAVSPGSPPCFAWVFPPPTHNGPDPEPCGRGSDAAQNLSGVQVLSLIHI